MENLALTTLTILLLAIPGYAARSAYFRGDFSAEVIRRSLTEEIYLSIILSLPFHVIAVMLIDTLYIRSIFDTYVDFEIALRFLSGKVIADPESGRSLADNLYQHLKHLAGYFAGLTGVAIFAGLLLRKAVWHWKLDVSFPDLFRYNNRWLYTFTGRDLEEKEPLYIVVDAMSVVGEKTRLYRGVVIGFDTNTEGDLEQIRLGLAFRGKFSDDERQEFYWQEIPGDVFIVKYATVQSLNVTRIRESEFDPIMPSFQYDRPTETADDPTIPPISTESQPSTAPPDPHAS